MATPALGAVSAGIRYQVRFFWRQALPMLFPNPTVRKVVMEHRGVDAVDDIVVYYTPPGVNDAGSTVLVDFHQLKFHVAQTGAVDHEVVIDPSWTGTKDAMLARLAAAWLSVHSEYRGARLSLVTNWPWDPASVVAPHIRDGGRLDDAFFAKGRSSRVGRVRLSWQKATGLDDEAFEAFVRALRFSTSSVSQADAELWLRDRCQLAGLVPIPVGVDHSAYDDLGARLIESGRTEQTPESLRELVEKQGLVATKESPFRSTFAVRSFSRFAHAAQTDGACVVDLTDLFDGRVPRDQGAWSGAIRQRLDDAISHVELLKQPVYVALDAHLSIAWYVGFLLGPKSGIGVVLRQRNVGKPIEIWDVSVPKRPEGAPSWVLTMEEAGECNPAAEIALVVSVTHDASTDAKRFIHEQLPRVKRIVHASLPKVGAQSVVDGAHARWLSDELVRVLTPHVAVQRPAVVHLFPSCPASFGFLLGQTSQVLGPTTVYEFAFGASGRAYEPGMTTIVE